MQKKAIDEVINGNEMVYIATLYDYGRVCRTCMLYVILLIIVWIIIICISGACFYFYRHIKGNYFNALSY